MASRLPAYLEVAGLIRAVESAGGFATVVAKGERDAGTIMVLCSQKGRDAVAYERMPQSDGSRAWAVSRRQDSENPHEFWDYCERRKSQDGDLWIVELDIADAERFIDSPGTRG
jgi:hypothetical protein